MSIRYTGLLQQNYDATSFQRHKTERVAPLHGGGIGLEKNADDLERSGSTQFGGSRHILCQRIYITDKHIVARGSHALPSISHQI